MPLGSSERIFLCYASEDRDHVIDCHHRLVSQGFDPWLDIMDLLPGQQWDREIRLALQSSRFVIVFFSRFSVRKRGYIAREFKLALQVLEEIPEDQIFIIPVRLDNCEIPFSFSHIHYVDLFHSNGFEKVIQVIAAELPSQSLFTDPRDGNTYRTVELLGKTWLAENLNFDVGDGCMYYDNDRKNEKTFGRLYTWEAALKACPDNWRIPTDDDWKNLLIHFDGYIEATELLKIEKIEGENAGPGGIFEGREKNLNLLAGGYYTTIFGGYFADLNESGFYWSAAGHGDDKGEVLEYQFHFKNQIASRNLSSKTSGISIRCIQD